MSLRRWIGRALFWFARSSAGGAVAGWSFAHASGAIPVTRLLETDSVIAFRHPQPSYAVHILIVPKQRIPTLLDLHDRNMRVVGDVIAVTQRLVRDLDLSDKGYRLQVNGGVYQDVRQLHFHLISGIARR
jgi:histidine triad (HIT) family protein